MSFKPNVEHMPGGIPLPACRSLCDFPAVIAPISINVVDSKKLNVCFSAAITAAPISPDDQLFQAESPPLADGLIYLGVGASPQPLFCDDGGFFLFGEIIPRAAYSTHIERIQRNQRTVNACAGIADPAQFIADQQVQIERLEALRMEFDFKAHLQRQREWSESTFGPDSRAKGVVDHIRKELTEIENAPGDLEEWIDVVILALDGAWRSGATPEQIISQLTAKQAKNESRQWPDWRTAPTDKAIEHDRSAEGGAA